MFVLFPEIYPCTCSVLCLNPTGMGTHSRVIHSYHILRSSPSDRYDARPHARRASPTPLPRPLGDRGQRKCQLLLCRQLSYGRRRRDGRGRRLFRWYEDCDWGYRRGGERQVGGCARMNNASECAYALAVDCVVRYHPCMWALKKSMCYPRRFRCAIELQLRQRAY